MPRLEKQPSYLTETEFNANWNGCDHLQFMQKDLELFKDTPTAQIKKPFQDMQTKHIKQRLLNYFKWLKKNTAIKEQAKPLEEIFTRVSHVNPHLYKNPNLKIKKLHSYHRDFKKKYFDSPSLDLTHYGALFSAPVLIEPKKEKDSKIYLFKRIYKNQQELENLLETYVKPLNEELHKSSDKENTEKLILCLSYIFFHRLAKPIYFDHSYTGQAIDDIASKLEQLNYSLPTGFFSSYKRFIYKLKNQVYESVGVTRKDLLFEKDHLPVYTPESSEIKSIFLKQQLQINPVPPYWIKGKNIDLEFARKENFLEALKKLQFEANQVKFIPYDDEATPNGSLIELKEQEMLLIHSANIDLNIYDADSKKLICALRSSLIPQETVKKTNHYLSGLNSEEVRYWGSTDKRRKQRDTSKNPKAMSGSLGFLAIEQQALISPTLLTVHNSQGANLYNALGEVAYHIEQGYTQVAPEEFQRAKENHAPFKSFLFPKTDTTASVTLNFDKPTSIHVDYNNNPDRRLTQLTVFYGGETRKYTGGQTVFCEYGFALDMNQGDVLFADFDRVHHYNMALQPGDPQEDWQENLFRISAVFYTRFSLISRRRLFKEASSDEEQSIVFNAQTPISQQIDTLLSQSKPSDSYSFGDYTTAITGSSDLTKDIPLIHEGGEVNEFKAPERDESEEQKTKKNKSEPTFFSDRKKKAPVVTQPEISPQAMEKLLEDIAHLIKSSAFNVSVLPMANLNSPDAFQYKVIYKFDHFDDMKIAHDLCLKPISQALMNSIRLGDFDEKTKELHLEVEFKTGMSVYIFWSMVSSLPKNTERSVLPMTF